MKTFQDFYLQKDYANALSVLEKNPSAFSKGLWHYNMGTLKAQHQQWAEARFHFILARENGFVEKANLENLQLVEEKLDVKHLEKPLSTTDYLIKGSLWASEGFLTTLSLLMLLVALWNLRKNKNYRMGAVYALLIALPLLLNFWIANWPRKMVIAAQMVQEGPSVIFGGTTELPPGVTLITKGKGDWLQIVYPSRFSGWIKETGVKSLETNK